MLQAAAKVLAPGQFFGAVSQAGHRAGVHFSESKYEGGQRLPRHCHEQAFFSLLLKGAYSEHYLNRENSYAPFSIVFHPPGEEHSTEMAAAGGRVFNVELRDHWLARLRECAPVPDTFAEAQGGELVWLAMRLYRACQTVETASALAIEGLVLEMLAVVARFNDDAGKQPPAWLNQAVDYLRAEFRRHLSVSEIAAVVGVSPLQLSRAFRQHQRQTISEYVHRLRVQFASEQLAEPETSLAEVALAAGFTDQSHFTRVFKQVTGLTPGSFQAALTAGCLQKTRLLA